jgi:hypothetical protein
MKSWRGVLRIGSRPRIALAIFASAMPGKIYFGEKASNAYAKETLSEFPTLYRNA